MVDQHGLVTVIVLIRQAHLVDPAVLVVLRLIDQGRTHRKLGVHRAEISLHYASNCEHLVRRLHIQARFAAT